MSAQAQLHMLNSGRPPAAAPPYLQSHNRPILKHVRGEVLKRLWYSGRVFQIPVVQDPRWRCCAGLNVAHLIE